MRKLLVLLIFCVLIVNCKNGSEKKEEGFEVSRTKTKEKVTENSKGVPIDMNNIGIGPIKDLTFPDQIDQEMAARGEEKFNLLCMACHLTDQRMIGPPMKGVYERRSPEWVMNFILNPSEMLQKDPIAKALYEEYGSIMQNQDITKEEARDIAEYLRTL